jgi:cell division topological specificity factor
MGILNLFHSTPPPPDRGSAAIAKERLQIVITHERGSHRGGPDYLPSLKKDLLEVIRKYVPISQEQVKVHLDKEGERDILELNITLPEEPISHQKDKQFDKGQEKKIDKVK